MLSIYQFLEAKFYSRGSAETYSPSIGRDGPISAARSRSKNTELTTVMWVADLPWGVILLPLY
jgi:hypothetical protein